MAIKKITAIVNELLLDDIEKALLAHGVTGFTVMPVKGRGNYCNTYTQDQLVKHSQIEIFSTEQYAQNIAQVIMQTADIGMNNEGLVAISPVDELFWVYQQTSASENDFNFH